MCCPADNNILSRRFFHPRLEQTKLVGLSPQTSETKIQIKHDTFEVKFNNHTDKQESP